MSRPIDVAFLTASGEVLACHRAVAPFRFLFGPRGCSATLEAEAGALAAARPGAIVRLDGMLP
jgi:uncharacterized membrane protein (UPF0127 family)